MTRDAEPHDTHICRDCGAVITVPYANATLDAARAGVREPEGKGLRSRGVEAFSTGEGQRAIDRATGAYGTGVREPDSTTTLREATRRDGDVVVHDVFPTHSADLDCAICAALRSPAPPLDERTLRAAWLRMDAVGDPRTAHSLWKHLAIETDALSEEFAHQATDALSRPAPEPLARALSFAHPGPRPWPGRLTSDEFARVVAREYAALAPTDPNPQETPE